MLIAEESDKLLGTRRRSLAEAIRSGGAERHRLPRRDRQDLRLLGTAGADVSREGVQRDLLPLIEGTTGLDQARAGEDRSSSVHRPGAFHIAKPSDLLPELQGRLPSASNCKALSAPT